MNQATPAMFRSRMGGMVGDGQIGQHSHSHSQIQNMNKTTQFCEDLCVWTVRTQLDTSVWRCCLLEFHLISISRILLVTVLMSIIARCSAVLQTPLLANVLADQCSHPPLCSTAAGEEMQNSPRHTDHSRCCLH